MYCSKSVVQVRKIWCSKTKLCVKNHAWQPVLIHPAPASQEDMMLEDKTMCDTLKNHAWQPVLIYPAPGPAACCILVHVTGTRVWYVRELRTSTSHNQTPTSVICRCKNCEGFFVARRQQNPHQTRGAWYVRNSVRYHPKLWKHPRCPPLRTSAFFWLLLFSVGTYVRTDILCKTEY